MNGTGKDQDICAETVPTRRRNIDGLDLARLREVLAYNPATGDLIWRVRLSPRCFVGCRAGKITLDGYRRISIDGRSYTASHLAWFHYYGTPPAGLIDHKNGDKDDGRIENLREATRSQNSQNIAVRSNSSTGLKGASRNNAPYTRAKFRSTITVNKKRIFLGLFMTAEEAHAAYCKKAAELHGQFARIDWKPEDTHMTNPIAALRAQGRQLSRRRPYMPPAAIPHASNLIEQMDNIVDEADLERLRPFMAESSRRLAAAMKGVG